LNHFIQYIEVLVEARHYDVSVFQDIINIDEDEYSSLDIYSVKFSICQSPACVDLGQLAIYSSMIIHEAVSNPVLISVLGNAMYDLMKFMGEKIPILLKSCKHTVQDVSVDCGVNIKNKEDTNIRINLIFSSYELNRITASLEQLNETINTLDLKGEVQIRYQDSKWYISN